MGLFDAVTDPVGQAIGLPIGELFSGFSGKTGAEAAERAGIMQSEAALEAARIAAGSQKEALGETRRQFDVIEGRISPLMDIERRGMERIEGLAIPAQEELMQLTGLGGPGAQMAAEQAFLESPAQQALRARAAKLSTRTSSAIGGLGGGNIRRELFEQGRGLDMQALQQRRQELGALAGRPLGTTGTQLGTRTGIQKAGALTDLMTSIGATQAGGVQQSGQALASGLLGAQQARAQGQSNAIGIGTLAASIFSDKNMKCDIHDLDLEECYNAVMNMELKTWRYLKETGLDQDIHFGPMAQDAPEMIKVPGKEMLNIHDELMMMAGAIQHMKNRGYLDA